MARAPVLAAGGIVLRPGSNAADRGGAAAQARRMGSSQRQARRRRNAARGRRARSAGRKPGTMCRCMNFWERWSMSLGGRSKIVHYWRMETSGGPTRELMDDVRAVDWLPLEAAVERLSRDHERAFLANVGPLALQSAALGKRSQETRRPSETKQDTKAAAPVKRRRRRTVAPKPSPALAPSVAPLPDVAVPAIAPVQPALSEHEAIGTGPSDLWAMPEMAQPGAEIAVANSVPADHASRDPAPFAPGATAEKRQQSLRVDLLRMVEPGCAARRERSSLSRSARSAWASWFSRRCKASSVDARSCLLRHSLTASPTLGLLGRCRAFP